MATGKITKRTLDALQSGGVTGFLWDDDLKGFGAKIASSGSASYVLQYRMGGREAKTRRHTIAQPGFTFQGATGTVKFLPSGDRNQPMQLVVVQAGGRSGYGYDFVPAP